MNRLLLPVAAVGRWLRATAVRAFALGPAVVERFEQEHGRDPSAFSPTAYGNYIVLSSAVYTCATYRAKNIARLPLTFWRTAANGKRTQVEAGPLVELFARVNPYWTLPRLLRMTELSRCLWGVSYWALERGRQARGRPTEIWWARPDRMRVLPHPTDYLAGFQYEHGGETIPFRPDEVVWLPLDNPLDEYAGLSPLASARLAIDTGQAALRSNRNLFANGMQLGGLITPEVGAPPLTNQKMDELEERFERRFRGEDKAHKWAILAGGLKVQSLGISPKDAEFLGLMKWSRGDVAMVFGIPPELIGDHEHATYSNIDQAYKGVWTDTLVPEAEDIANQLTEQVLPLLGGADVAAFDFSGIASLQEDRGSLVDQMAKLWAMGVPLNPLLQEFQPTLLPPNGTGYPWGDVAWLGTNVQPVNGPALPAPQAPEPPSGGGVPAADEGADDEPADGEGATPQRQAARALGLVERLLADERARQQATAGPPAHENGHAAAAILARFAPQAARHEQAVAATLRDLYQRQEASVLARLRIHPLTGEDELVPFDAAKWGREWKLSLAPILRAALAAAGTEAGGAGFDAAHPAAVRWLEGTAQRAARHGVGTLAPAIQRAVATALEDGADAPAVWLAAREACQREAARAEQLAAGLVRSTAQEGIRMGLAATLVTKEA